MGLHIRRGLLTISETDLWLEVEQSCKPEHRDCCQVWSILVRLRELYRNPQSYGHYQPGPRGPFTSTTSTNTVYNTCMKNVQCHTGTERGEPRFAASRQPQLNTSGLVSSVTLRVHGRGGVLQFHDKIGVAQAPEILIVNVTKAGYDDKQKCTKEQPTACVVLS